MKYENQRFRLFTSSYIGYKLRLYLRDKYGYNRKGGHITDYWLQNFRCAAPYRDTIEDIRAKLKQGPDNTEFQLGLLAQYSSMEREVTADIPRLAEFLRFSELALKSFIFSGTNDLLDSKPRLVFQQTSFNQIYEEGLYIKIEPGTNRTEVGEAYDWIVQNRDRYSVGGVLKELPQKRISKHDESGLWLYNLVEKEMIELEEARKQIPKTHIDYKYYQEGLVRLAIERVVGNVLGANYIPDNVKGDKIFMKIEKEGYPKVTELYYRVAESYRLPTPKKWTTILELIK